MFIRLTEYLNIFNKHTSKCGVFKFEIKVFFWQQWWKLKGVNRCFYKYINNKKRTKENLSLIGCEEKHCNQGWGSLRCLVCLSLQQKDRFSSWQPAPWAGRERWRAELTSCNLEKSSQWSVGHLDTRKCMGLNGTQQSVLWELAEELAKPFSIVIVSPDKLGRFQTTGG